MLIKASCRALSFALIGLWAGGACTSSDFAGGAKSDQKKPTTEQDAKTPGGDDPTPLTLPEGGQKDVDNLPSGIESCKSADESIATVDPEWCTVTGVKAGTTSLIITMTDGSTQTVPIEITSKDDDAPIDTTDSGISVAPNSPVATDDGANRIVAPPAEAVLTDDGEVKSIRGNVCLGGPLCNVSYLTRTVEEAQTCMQTANSKACVNDGSCGSNYKLHVCNCECDSATALPFDAPDTCRRFNPQKANAHERVAQCHKI